MAGPAGNLGAGRVAVLAARKGAEATVERAQLPDPRRHRGSEIGAEDRVEQEESDEDPVRDDEGQLAGPALELLLQRPDPADRLLEALAGDQLADAGERQR